MAKFEYNIEQGRIIIGGPRNGIPEVLYWVDTEHVVRNWDGDIILKFTLKEPVYRKRVAKVV